MGTKEEKERQLYINEAGKLPLHAFRKQFKFHINYGLADISIDRLIKDLEKGEVIIDWDVYLPTKGINLQRGFVWSLGQKEQLILSILKGITIPPITLIQFRKDDPRAGRQIRYSIIDGKQRLSTLISFVKGEFEVIHKGFWEPGFSYKDLTLQAQREIYDSVRCNVAYEYEDKLISDEDKIAWFEMINFAGTPQDKDHLKKLKE